MTEFELPADPDAGRGVLTVALIGCLAICVAVTVIGAVGWSVLNARRESCHAEPQRIVTRPTAATSPAETVETFTEAITAGDYETVQAMLAPTWPAQSLMDPGFAEPSYIGNICTISDFNLGVARFEVFTSKRGEQTASGRIYYREVVTITDEMQGDAGHTYGLVRSTTSESWSISGIGGG